MKARKLVSSLFVLIFPILGIAQDDVVEVINEMVQAGDYETAMATADDYLKKYPEDVNVLMMNGNVRFYEFQNSRDYIQVSANDNLSIYDNSIGMVHAPTIVMPDSTGRDIASYYARAVAIDPQRQDIHFGMCYTYSMALLKDELKQQIQVIHKLFAPVEGLEYTLGDYARLFDDRDRFEDCMDIYELIVSLYPDNANLISDMAAMAFGNGDLDLASQKIGEALQAANPDAMTLGNAVLIRSINGQYDDALKHMKAVNKLEPDNRDWLIYQAFLDHYKGNRKWQKPLKKYLDQKADSDSSMDVRFARAAIELKDKTFEEYLNLNKVGSSSFYRFLHHEHAMKFYPDEFLPLFNYAELQCYYRNYDKALEKLDAIEVKGLEIPGDKLDDYHAVFGWTLFDQGKVEAAHKHFEALLGSEEFHFKSMGAFFVGKYYEDKDDPEKALSYYELVSEEASQGKYATLAWNCVNRINDDPKD